MFGPDDPGYSAESLRAYQARPEWWNTYREHAHALVGCAAGHVVMGTAEDLRQAKRAVSHAIKLFMTTGLTQEQAADRVVALAQMLGSLE